MKLDLHTHSIIGSACSHQTIEQIIEDARAAGLDGVCLTDHNNMHGREAAERAADATGFPVFVGMEMNCRGGDLLVFGNLREDGYPVVEYEMTRLLIDPEECSIIPAHCYRGDSPHMRMPDIIREFYEDFAAVEVYSVNMTTFDSECAIRLADEVGLPMVGCGDSHGRGTAGANYTEFEDWIDSLDDLIRALKSGRFRAVSGRSCEKR